MANTLLEDKTTKLLHHMNLWQIPYLKIRLQNFSIIWTMANTLLEDKTTNLLHHMNRWQIPYLKIRLQNFSIIWTYAKYLTWIRTNLLHHMNPWNTLLEDKTTKLLHHMNLWQIPYLKIRLRTFSIIWTDDKYLTWR